MTAQVSQPTGLSLAIVVRWIAVPIATFVVMLVSGIGLMSVGDVLRSLSRTAVESRAITAGGWGVLVAISMLTTAWRLAPSHRRHVLVAVYLVGVWLTWQVLGDWYYPEGHPRAYQPSMIPLGITLVGGLLFAGMLWLRSTPRTKHDEVVQ